MRYIINNYVMTTIDMFTNVMDIGAVRQYLLDINNVARVVTQKELLEGIEGITLSEKKRRQRIIESVYRYFDYRQKQPNKQLTSNEINSKEIYKDYVRYLLHRLDDGERTYDMSDLFNEQFLAIKETKVTKTGIRIISRDVQTNERDDTSKKYSFFSNSSNKRVGIKKVNTVSYKTLNGAIQSIDKYLVLLPNGTEYEVYSTINMLEMQKNPEYRAAVLNSLLSKRNILLSNAEGYIGTILPHKGKIGEEKKNENGYSYQVSKNYVLVYDPEDLSATISLNKRLNNPHRDEGKQNEVRRININTLIDKGAEK